MVSFGIVCLCFSHILKQIYRLPVSNLIYSQKACCSWSVFLWFRSVFPAVVPGEQLVPGGVGHFLPGLVPVCLAALLALCLSWHQGSGDYICPYIALLLYLIMDLTSRFTCFPQGERKCLTFYLPKLIIVGLLWLSSVTLGIWQT